MLSISHAATGAFIATKIPNPLLSVPLILASHYLEDAVHHWDMGTGLSKGTRTRKQAFWWGIFDLILAALLVLTMYPPSIGNWSLVIGNLSSPPYWGAMLGLLPDFLEAPRNFLKYEPVWLRPLNRFHNLFHHSIPDMAAGLAPQIILLLCLWFLK